MTTYSNVDTVSYFDSRRSTRGYAIFLGDALIL